MSNLYTAQSYIDDNGDVQITQNHSASYQHDGVNGSTVFGHGGSNAVTATTVDEVRVHGVSMTPEQYQEMYGQELTGSKVGDSLVTFKSHETGSHFEQQAMQEAKDVQHGQDNQAPDVALSAPRETGEALNKIHDHVGSEEYKRIATSIYKAASNPQVGDLGNGAFGADFNEHSDIDQSTLKTISSALGIADHAYSEDQMIDVVNGHIDTLASSIGKYCMSKHGMSSSDVAEFRDSLGEIADMDSFVEEVIQGKTELLDNAANFFKYSRSSQLN